MCKCNGIAIGSYAATVGIVTPEHMRGYEDGCYVMRDVLDIDACVVPELAALWRRGIVTVGSCCGHNQLPGYIQVREEDVPMMKALGYELDGSASETAFLLREQPHE